MDLDELVFHPWTVQGQRDVLTLVRGSGSHVVDADGRRYLDFSSQLVFTNLGHQHPRIVAAIKQPDKFGRAAGRSRRDTCSVDAAMPTALDNGRCSPKQPVRAVVAHCSGGSL
jgi:4-aminobutyrate aminotransferase-like enzyme